MSRSTASLLLTALQGSEVQPYFAFKLEFDNGTLRYWTGIGDRTVDSETYIGSGQVIGLSGVEEVVDLSAKKLTLTANGLDSSIVNLALTEPYQNRPASVYFGEQSISDAIKIFAGTIDQMTILDEGDTSTIQIVLESNLVRLQSSSSQRYTDENHQSRYDGDTFFSYVQDIQDRQIIWGRNNA